MVDGIRTVDRAPGHGPQGSGRRGARRRPRSHDGACTGRRDLRAGDTVGAADLVALRPGTGLRPGERDALVGRTVRRAGPGRSRGRAATISSRQRAAPDGAPRPIAVLTTGRQDWGILRSTATALRANPDTRLVLLVGGTHLAGRYGRTLDDITGDGFVVDRRAALADRRQRDPPVAVQAGSALAMTAAALEETRPAALVLVGDRFETMAAAVGATLAGAPIVHLHGGEQTGGAFDDAFRHAITKLAHLHLVSHEEHAARVRALGEDPSTIHVVGAPGLDNAVRVDLPDRAELEGRLGLALDVAGRRRDGPARHPGRGPVRRRRPGGRGDGRRPGDVRRHAPQRRSGLGADPGSAPGGGRRAPGPGGGPGSRGTWATGGSCGSPTPPSATARAL